MNIVKVMIMRNKESEERKQRLRHIISNLPSKPGSYQFYDSEGKIIYVGKAKNLKNRVSSYFHKEVDRLKTKILVSKIEDIKYQGTQQSVLNRKSFYTVLSYGYSSRIVSKALKGDLNLSGDVMTETILGLLMNNKLD